MTATRDVTPADMHRIAVTSLRLLVADLVGYIGRLDATAVNTDELARRHELLKLAEQVLADVERQVGK